MNYQIKYLSTRECQTCLPKEAGSSSSGTSIPQLKITAGAIMECLYVLNVTSF